MRRMMVWGWALACGFSCVACSDDDDDASPESGKTESATEQSGRAAATGKGGRADDDAQGGRAGKPPGAGADGKSYEGKADLAAFEATGLNKYLGEAKPAQTEVVDSETHYFFDEADGPVCLRGGRFAMSTRATDSEDLVIYLQGGGSCTTALCRATETADPKIPARGLLAASDDENPVAHWNVVYSPYCDGSLHFGDNDIPDQNRKHHGLRNVSAALDVAREKFPKPKRILLTGASAGGYGTIWLTDLVRLIYPDAQLFVLNDAGIAISNPTSATGFKSVLEEWGALQFMPASCDECRESPHLTPWMTWNLHHDESMTLGLFSAYEDSVIAGTFLMLDPQVFKTALLEETGKVVDAAPERAKRFLIDGTQHTLVNLHTTRVGDLSIGAWLAQMLDADPAWDNVLQ